MDIDYKKLWDTLKAESGDRTLMGRVHLQDPESLQDKMNSLEDRLNKGE